MDKILELYLEYQNWINLIKDFAFLAGAIAVLRGAYLFFQYIKNRGYTEKAEEIDKNINFRERLEPVLNDYIFEKAKGTKDISIRFVNWKNYPWNLDEDGFKFLLRINYLEETPHYGWIDNTGVYFEEPVWWLSNSIYIDKNGIFFIDQKDKTHKGFTEIDDAVLRLHMPFSNIVNYDFRERIEYEPVFYIKHQYLDWKKLYNDKVSIREKQGTKYKKIELSQSKMIVRFSQISYKIMQLKLFCINLINKKESDS
jgi:hypothetical protein